MKVLFPEIKRTFTQTFLTWGDRTLTVALLLAAAVLIWIALTQGPVTKAIALAYAVFP